jgi:hypothetical protein
MKPTTMRNGLKKMRILDNLKKEGGGGQTAMTKFLIGVIVGIVIFFLFIWFGGAKTVMRVGEGLTDTGKKMEIIEEKVRKEKDEIGRIIKGFFQDEKEVQKKNQ